MKRTRTLIEQKLQQDGFILTSKWYCGKHSEKTFYYTYQKELDRGYSYLIHLNYKRNKIVKYGIPNVNLGFVSEETLNYLHDLFLKLREYVEEVKEFANPIPKELLESVE